MSDSGKEKHYSVHPVTHRPAEMSIRGREGRREGGGRRRGDRGRERGRERDRERGRGVRERKRLFLGSSSPSRVSKTAVRLTD